jgi:hypothetical protein
MIETNGKMSHLVFFLISFFFFCSLITIFSPSYARTEIIPLNHLLQNKKEFDGHEITIKGEVIGDIMRRREGNWLNIDDNNEGIGTWVLKGSLPKIDFVGGYSSKGDIHMIKGIFNRACPVHGGETDIHAFEIKRIQVGHPITHSISLKKLNWSFVLLILTISTIGIY